jgi:AcrR family transcriptional regulator
VQRLEDIVETGIKVFHERGYDAGTLDDVAEVLQLRRASLYHYLRSKGELLYLIFDRAIKKALERLDQIADIDDPKVQILAFVEHQARMVAQDPGLFAVAFDHRTRLEKEFADRILQDERDYVRRVTAMVERAKQAGMFAEVDPRHAAHALIGISTWVYKWFDPERDNYSDVARDLVAIVRVGLGDGQAFAVRERPVRKSSRKPR